MTIPSYPPSPHCPPLPHPMNLCLFLVFVFVFVFAIHHYTPSLAENEQFSTCKRTSHCGNITGVTYPFFDGITRPEYCGHPGFKLFCGHGAPKISISGQDYYLLGIDTNTSTIKVSWTDNLTGTCPEGLLNATIDFTKFGLSSADQIITFFKYCHIYPSEVPVKLPHCNFPESSLTGYFLTRKMVDGLDGYNGSSLIALCKSVLNLPILRSAVAEIDRNPSLLEVANAFRAGFELRLIADTGSCDSCVGSGGACGHDSSSGKFVCYRADQKGMKSTTSGDRNITYLVIGVTIAASLLVAFVLAWFLVRKQLIAQQKDPRDRVPGPSSSSNNRLRGLASGINGLPSTQADTSNSSTNYSRSLPSYASPISDIERGSNYFGVRLFDYSELQQATDNFNESRELGSGGFGSVYYGHLLDGCPVAVKRLHENNYKCVEKFMNEIDILALLRHKNLITFYGCTSTKSSTLLLVYEYISNGTVADHLHGKIAESTFLEWPIRLSIAVETAEALAYLHRSDVIHRDVKTTNILLDSSFHVKVADFGLSRLFPNDVSHVSTAPQGSPGYVDPQYYHCYRLTEKSDVYSFGVVLIELISSKQAMDKSRPTDDVNLANMALDRIQNGATHELVDPRLGFERDHAVQRTVDMVAELGFQCLQQDRDMRPTMEEAAEALRRIQLHGANAQKQEGANTVSYKDDVGLMNNVDSSASLA